MKRAPSISGFVLASALLAARPAFAFISISPAGNTNFSNGVLVGSNEVVITVDGVISTDITTQCNSTLMTSTPQNGSSQACGIFTNTPSVTVTFPADGNTYCVTGWDQNAQHQLGSWNCYRTGSITLNSISVTSDRTIANTGSTYTLDPTATYYSVQAKYTNTTGSAVQCYANNTSLGSNIDYLTGLIPPIPPGTYPYTLYCTAGASTSGSLSVSVVLPSPVALTVTGAPTSGTAGTAYSGSVSATGGAGAMAYSALGLPPGLNLNAGTGAITGTPTTAGTYPVTFTAKAATAGSASASVTMTIAPSGNITLNSISVTSDRTIANTGSTYTLDPTATYYSVQAKYTNTTGSAVQCYANNTSLGSNIDYLTGLIPPIPPGTYPYTLYCTAGASTSGSLSVSVVLPSPVALTVTGAPTSGTAGTAYSGSVSATGGAGAMAYSALGLPPGLNLNAGTGAITGTPTTAGTYPVTFTAKAATAGSASASVTMTIAPSGNITLNSISVTSDRTIANTGSTYTLDPTATYYSVQAKYTNTTGSAVQCYANNTSLGSNIDYLTGLIPPIPPGTYPYTLYCTAGASTSGSLSVSVVLPSPVALTVTGAPTSGTAGTAYSGSVSATGGAGAMAYSALGLPPGLNLNAGTGAITGTPTTAGTYPVTFTAKAATAGSASASVTMTIAPSGNITLNSISVTSDRTIANTGSTYTLDPTATYYSVQAKYTNTTGSAVQCYANNTSLGSNIDYLTGLIPPIPPGTYPYTLYCTAGASTSGSLSVSVVLPSPVALTVTGAPTSGTAGTAYSGSVSATGGAGAMAYSALGLPPGLNLNAGTGAITGTPTTAGTYPVTFTAKAATAGSASASVTMTIAPSGNITLNSISVTSDRTIANTGSTYTLDPTATYYSVQAKYTNTTGSAVQCYANNTSLGSNIDYLTGLIPPIPPGTYPYTLYCTAGASTSGSLSVSVVLPSPVAPPTGLSVAITQIPGCPAQVQAKATAVTGQIVQKVTLSDGGVNVCTGQANYIQCRGFVPSAMAGTHHFSAQVDYIDKNGALESTTVNTDFTYSADPALAAAAPALTANPTTVSELVNTKLAATTSKTVPELAIFWDTLQLNSCFNANTCAASWNWNAPTTGHFTAAAYDGACNQITSSPPTLVTVKPPTITNVAITASKTTLYINQTSVFSSLVTQDSLPVPNASLTWNLTPPTGCGTLTSASGANTTYVAGPAACTASVTGSYQGTDSPPVGITVNMPQLTLSPLNSVLPPGQSETLTVTSSDGNPPPEITWTPSGSCILSSAQGAKVTITAPSTAGYCTVRADGPGFSQTANITVTNITVNSVIISTMGSINLLPNHSEMLSIEVLDQAKNPTKAYVPQVMTSPSAACSAGTLSSNPTGNVFTIDILAGSNVGTCVVTATAGNQSASLSIKISQNILNFLAPSNNQSYVLLDETRTVGFAGQVTGAAQVNLGVPVNKPVPAGATDPSGLRPWSYTWTQADGLTGGKFTVTASADPAPSQTVSFCVFKFPPKPTKLTLDPSQVYTGDSTIVRAIAVDDESNPDCNGVKNGIQYVSFQNVTRTVGGVMTPDPKITYGWTSPLTAPSTRGTLSLTAVSRNFAAANSPPSDPASLQVLQRPTVTIASPFSTAQGPAMFTSGASVPILVGLMDPDRMARSVEVFSNGLSIGKVNISGITSVTLSTTVAMLNGNPFTTLTAVVSYTDLNDPQGINMLTNAAPPVTIAVMDAPTVTAPAGAIPNPVAGSTTTILSATGYTPFGASWLNYQWKQSAGDPAPVTFDFGGNNPTTHVTFAKAGSYIFTATLKDPLGASVQTSTTVVVVSGLQVSPSPAYALTGGTVQFTTTGRDQFGNALSMGAAVWSTDCPAVIGAIDSGTGIFTAAGKGGPCRVTINAGGLSSGSALVSVVQNIPPTVQITSLQPSNPNFAAPMTITLTADAADADGAVAQVQFFANGLPIGPAIAQAPYTFAWTNMLPGNYYVTATATDSSGAVTTSAAIPVTVKKPLLVITKVTPPNARTQDNSPTGHDFIFTVEGSGFVQGNFQGGSLVYWNGSPVSTFFKSGDILDAVLEVHLHNGELLNPKSSYIQVYNPVDPSGPRNSNVSPEVFFVVDGAPIILCLNVGAYGGCPQNAHAAGAAGFSAAALSAELPQLSRNDEITAVTQFTDGGIQWTLFAGAASPSALAALSAGSGAPQPTLFASDFLAGQSFKLSKLPPLAAGTYTLTAQGKNLIGELSSPASITIFLAATNLTTARVYPNPWRVDQHAGLPLKFDLLPPGSQVKIFTVSGHWVQTLTADDKGVATWDDLTNSRGEKVQSGLYLFLATDGQGGKARGKFSIIR